MVWPLTRQAWAFREDTSRPNSAGEVLLSPSDLMPYNLSDCNPSGPGIELAEPAPVVRRVRTTLADL